MSNPSQLLLLADHIKLSLLERQRALSLNLEPNSTQESNISRSLESLREGIEALESRSQSSTSEDDSSTTSHLRAQYNDLSRQFHGDNPSTSTTVASTLTNPNDPRLKDDFARAKTRSSTDQTRTRPATNQPPLSTANPASGGSRNVRFRDNPSSTSLDDEDQQNRASLFPSRYRDDDASYGDGNDGDVPDPTSQLSNQQIHTYHASVIREQDEQLDRLGESIGRQRYLGMQISDELEGQIGLLDEVDGAVDRHQGRLDGAKKRLRKVSEKAKDNWGMTTIIALIVLLVLLIAILK